MNILNIRFSRLKQKPLLDSNSGHMNHKPKALSTRLCSKVHVVVDKILLILRNVVSIRGQPYCDGVIQL